MVRLRVPGSKSHTHRAYVLAARSEVPVAVRSPLRAADPDATLHALHALGARMELGEGHVGFQPATPVAPHGVLDLQNAGTGLRLLTAQAATLQGPVSLTGDASLRSRPHGPLLEALQQLGARIDGASGGRCPYTVQGPIHGGAVELPAGVSSQYASALMLALPLLEADSLLRLQPPIKSRPYLEVTQHVAKAFELRLQAEGDSFRIPGSQVPRCARYDVPGDWSSAAFPLVAAAITGVSVELEGLDPDDVQGDRAIVEQLEGFGARTTWQAGTLRLEADGLESPGTIDVSATPDMFPALCIAAAVARGTTTFTGGESLRHKESDRIAAMAEGLQVMGIEARQQPGGLVVTGGKPQGATVSCRHDHRIHMAFAVLALLAPSTIDAPESVAVSYPAFHRHLQCLREAA